MSILGIGVDVLHVPRLASFIRRKIAHKLASRILSPVELSVWDAISNQDEARRVRFLAVRWSVKEAAYKALYPAARPRWKELTFLNHPGVALGMKPVLQYHPVCASVKVGRLHASVSHDGDYIFASVLGETACPIESRTSPMDLSPQRVA